LLSIFKRGITESITYGILNVICASSSVANPGGMFRNTNSSSSEMPVTISGLMTGM
jgi:hypothetical protein